MATINGLTAEAMDAIRDGVITGATVNGSGHLILTRHDASTIDAGSVIGPTGSPGVSLAAYNAGLADKVTDAELAAAISAALDAYPRGHLWSSSHFDFTKTIGDNYFVTSPNIAMVSGRLYEARVYIDNSDGYGGPDDIQEMFIQLDGTNVTAGASFGPQSGDLQFPFVIQGQFTASTGNHVVRGMIKTLVGFPTYRVQGYLRVYDIGLD